MRGVSTDLLDDAIFTDGAPDHVGEEKIIGEALVSHGASLGIVKNDRGLSFFQFGEDWIEVRIPPFLAGDRRRLDVERLAAQFARPV